MGTEEEEGEESEEMNRNSKIHGSWSSKVVTIDGGILKPCKSQKVWNHSPDGFNWSYGGSGPAQLALALLLEAGDVKAKSHYQIFKQDIISGLPSSNFDMDASVIYDWIDEESRKECIPQ